MAFYKNTLIEYYFQYQYFMLSAINGHVSSCTTHGSAKGMDYPTERVVSASGVL